MGRRWTAGWLALGLTGCVALNDAFDVDAAASATASNSASGSAGAGDVASGVSTNAGSMGDGNTAPSSNSAGRDDTAADSGPAKTSGGQTTTSGRGSSTTEIDDGDPTRPVRPMKMLWLTENVQGDLDGGGDHLAQGSLLCEDALTDSLPLAGCASAPVALLGSSLGDFDDIPAFAPDAAFLLDDGPFVAASTGLPIVAGWDDLATGAINPGFLPDLLLPYGQQNDAFLDYWIGPRADEPLGPSCENWTTASDGVFGQQLRVTSDEESFAIATECGLEPRVLCACLGIPDEG